MEGFHPNDYSKREPWSAQQKYKATAKPKTLREEKNQSLALAHSCSQNQLDSADFLIDGLFSAAPVGAGPFPPTQNKPQRLRNNGSAAPAQL
jgi:hypothetical protein